MTAIKISSASVIKIITTILFSFYVKAYSQVNEDSVMLSKSEQWKIEQKKGLFGLSKPLFGIFTTLNVIKIDSGFYKKKIKDSASLDFGV